MKTEIKLMGFVGFLLLVVAGLIVYSIYMQNVVVDDGKVNDGKVNGDDKLKRFSSYEELKGFLKENIEASYYGYGSGLQRTRSGAFNAAGAAAGAQKEANAGGGAGDYSKTNIQVEGVDEPDIVKNDGKYIYSINGDRVVIVDAFPAEGMKILSEINKSASDIFINGDKLIIFADEWEEIEITDSKKVADGIGIFPSQRSRMLTHVFIYDIKDRSNPVLDNEIFIDGNYIDARMIDNYVYVISTQYVYGEDPILPIYRINGIEEKVLASDIYYFDSPDNDYVFNSISAVNIENGDFSTKVYLTGGTNDLYVSEENIYLSYTKRISGGEYTERSIKEIIIPLLPENEKENVLKVLDSEKNLGEKVEEVSKIIQDYSISLKGDEKADFDKKLYDGLREFDKKIRKESEKSVIHKISVDENKIVYQGVGEVPGHILNQFSMDEHDEYFRIATTVGDIWDGSSVNNVYVLDSDMRVVGKIEDLAPGEKIYSARFIGNRIYMVTFKKVDPFYVIDLSNVENPKVLGYLKIPGYSDYLHPYDENHIIGIGKEAVDASAVEIGGRGLDFAWYQGLKIAIFDVSDVANPKESAKIVIGDRGTDSEALNDHKAFLFDKKKNLLVIPVYLAEINKSRYEGGKISANTYGDIIWQGAYVFDINLNEIKVKGKITHFDSFTNKRYFRGYGAESIQRSLYMDDVLYTISQKKIKANDLEDLQDIGKVDLPFKQDYHDDVIY